MEYFIASFTILGLCFLCLGAGLAIGHKRDFNPNCGALNRLMGEGGSCDVCPKKDDCDKIDTEKTHSVSESN